METWFVIMIRSVHFARGTCRGRRRRLPPPPTLQRRTSSTSYFSTTTPPTAAVDEERRPPPPPPTPDDDILEDSSTIVRGPSLLASTGAHRPSPSLFHLPGLRSLPFWTAPAPPSSPAEEGRRGRGHRIAFNDPTLSSAVSHLESNYDDIRSEYFAAVLGQGTVNDGGGDPKRPLEPDYDVSSRGGEHASDALHTGSWDWHSCVLNGIRNEGFRERCPKTSAVVDDVSISTPVFFRFDVGFTFPSSFRFSVNAAYEYFFASSPLRTTRDRHHRE
jgi:hypothetical protein